MKSSEETKNLQCDNGTADASALDKASKTQRANGECSKTNFASMLGKPSSEGSCGLVISIITVISILKVCSLLPFPLPPVPSSSFSFPPLFPLFSPCLSLPFPASSPYPPSRPRLCLAICLIFLHPIFPRPSCFLFHFFPLPTPRPLFLFPVLYTGRRLARLTVV